MQISHVWLHFFNLPPYAEKKPSEYCNFFAFADGGNRTRATCAASKRAIHYTIASWQLNEILAMVLFTTTSNGHSDFFVLFLFFRDEMPQKILRHDQSLLNFHYGGNLSFLAGGHFCFKLLNGRKLWELIIIIN